MTPSPIVGASAHRWPMDLRTDALRNHHPRMPQYSPIVIDSFRAEELSTRREDLALPLYEELQNQVILSATLKGQEAGKYDERTDVHSIDFSGYAVNHLLSEDYVEQFMRKLESFNVKLNVK